MRLTMASELTEVRAVRRDARMWVARCPC